MSSSSDRPLRLSSPSPPRYAFQDYREESEREPTPPEVVEEQVRNWVNRKMNEYQRSVGGRIESYEDSQRVKAIFEQTIRKKLASRARPSKEEKKEMDKREKEVSNYRRTFERTPEGAQARQNKKQRKWTENEYLTQNEEHGIEVTDFAYPPATKKEMLYGDLPVLGIRRRSDPPKPPKPSSSAAVSEPSTSQRTGDPSTSSSAGEVPSSSSAAVPSSAPRYSPEVGDEDFKDDSDDETERVVEREGFHWKLG
jgi:hypothetical protein